MNCYGGDIKQAPVSDVMMSCLFPFFWFRYRNLFLRNKLDAVVCNDLMMWIENPDCECVGGKSCCGRECGCQQSRRQKSDD